MSEVTKAIIAANRTDEAILNEIESLVPLCSRSTLGWPAHRERLRNLVEFLVERPKAAHSEPEIEP